MNLRRKQKCQTSSNLILRDYSKPNWKESEKIGAILISIALTILLAWFFYRQVLAAVVLSPIGYFIFRYLRNQRIKRNYYMLEEQFKECILSVATSLKAGYAIENAFVESMEDIVSLYGENSFMLGELKTIKRGLSMNKSIEELLLDFAKRSGSDNIIQFSQVLSIAKHRGGNVPDIIRTSAELISREIEATSEIRTLLSGRRMEQNIMKIMPFAIIEYISLTSPGYFDSLYGNRTGIIIMSGCLILYVLAFFFGEKIFIRLESM